MWLLSILHLTTLPIVFIPLIACLVPTDIISVDSANMEETDGGDEYELPGLVEYLNVIFKIFY
jgi:hypothetical protein